MERYIFFKLFYNFHRFLQCSLWNLIAPFFQVLMTNNYNNNNNINKKYLKIKLLIFNHIYP